MAAPATGAVRVQNGTPFTLRVTRAADGTVTGVLASFSFFPVRLTAADTIAVADALRTTATDGVARAVTVARLR